MKPFVRSLRLFIWFWRAYLEKHGQIIFLTFIASFLIFLVFFKFSPLLLSPFLIKINKIAVVGSYTPTTLPLYIQNLISKGLTAVDESGQAIPSLALNWEIKDEGKTYFFNLRDNLFWHDGSRFTSSDINYALKDVSFEPITNTLLKVSLKESFSPLPTILAKPIFKKGLVGLGDYKINKLVIKGDKVVSLELLPFKKNLPQLQYKFYSNETEAVTAFKLGNVNILDKISNQFDFNKWPNVSISKKIYFNYNVMLFYNTRLPFLQKRQVRQALAFAIPAFGEEPSLGPLNPDSWAYNANVKNFAYNLQTAKNLLEKEEIATSSDQITISTFSSFLAYAQKIANSWESLGVKTNIKVENSLPTQFDVLLVSQEIPADPDQYHLWHSTQTTNLTGFANPKLDKLLEDGRKNTDKEKRVLIYKDFQRYLVEEAPAIFLYHPRLYTIERK